MLDKQNDQYGIYTFIIEGNEYKTINCPCCKKLLCKYRKDLKPSFMALQADDVNYPGLGSVPLRCCGSRVMTK